MPLQSQQSIPVRMHETDGNGVLVLSIPNARDGHRGAAASFRLEAVEPIRGVRVGRPARGPAAA